MEKDQYEKQWKKEDSRWGWIVNADKQKKGLWRKLGENRLLF